MTTFRQPLIALDVETTGLDERPFSPLKHPSQGGDKLLQVSAVALDGLDKLIVKKKVPVAFNGYIRVHPDGPEFHNFLRHSIRRDEDGNEDRYVFNMHKKSNVWASVSGDTSYGTVDDRFSTFHKDERDLGDALAAWIDAMFGKQTPDLLGASITLDRNFMREFIPAAHDKINYRSLDVSSVRNWFIAADQPIQKFQSKDAEHNGLDDALFTAVHGAKLADMTFGGDRTDSLLAQFRDAGLPFESISKSFEESVVER